jgi:hypothetical protein
VYFNHNRLAKKYASQWLIYVGCVVRSRYNAANNHRWMRYRYAYKSCQALYQLRRDLYPSTQQRFCSPRYRLIAFQRRQGNVRIDREAKIRFYLQQALSLLGADHDVAYGDNRGTHIRQLAQGEQCHFICRFPQALIINAPGGNSRRQRTYKPLIVVGAMMFPSCTKLKPRHRSPSNDATISDYTKRY